MLELRVSPVISLKDTCWGAGGGYEDIEVIKRVFRIISVSRISTKWLGREMNSSKPDGTP